MNKTAVVTGSGSGIGKAMAIGLGRNGFNLVLIGRNKNNLEETAARIKDEKPNLDIKVLPADLTKRSEAITISSKIPKVDLLYNGIANWVDHDFKSATFDEIEETVDAVYKANLLITKALLQKIINSRGIIINIISDWGVPEADAPALFGSAKNAHSAFGIMLGKELKSNDVNVINIYPTDVTSKGDIDDDTQKAGQIRLKDLVREIIKSINSKRRIAQVHISHLGKNLEVAIV